MFYLLNPHQNLKQYYIYLCSKHNCYYVVVPVQKAVILVVVVVFVVVLLLLLLPSMRPAAIPHRESAGW